LYYILYSVHQMITSLYWARSRSLKVVCITLSTLLNTQQIAQGSVHHIEHFTEHAADCSR